MPYPPIEFSWPFTDLYSDTEHLAYLIDERDDILDHLEMAETRYIASFRTSTPEPSLADFELPTSGPTRPEISRPMPLGGAYGV